MSLISLKKETGNTTTYEFNKNYSAWKPVSKKRQVVSKLRTGSLENVNGPVSKTRHTKDISSKDISQKIERGRALAPSPLREKTSFQKPELDEIEAYCKERGNGIDAELFFDKHEASDWVVNGSPVRDWRALVRVWEKRHRGQGDHQDDGEVRDIDMAVVIREGLRQRDEYVLRDSFSERETTS